MQGSTVLLAARRLPMTTKRGSLQFYKGTGSGSTGRHTKHGRYIIDWAKVRTYVVPSLEGFALKPFVAPTVRPAYGRFKGTHPVSGARYLQQWKDESGEYEGEEE